MASISSRQPWGDIVVEVVILNGYHARAGRVVPLVAFRIGSGPVERYHTVETDSQDVTLGVDYFTDWRSAQLAAERQRQQKEAERGGIC